jgi:DNA-directed RNA polymerase subunit K/omega
MSSHNELIGIPATDGKYLVINVLTRRAKDLQKSGKPTIPYAEGNFDPVDVAKEELSRGNLIVRRRNELTNELEKFEDIE